MALKLKAGWENRDKEKNKQTKQKQTNGVMVENCEIDFHLLSSLYTYFSVRLDCN